MFNVYTNAEKLYKEIYDECQLFGRHDIGDIWVECNNIQGKFSCNVKSAYFERQFNGEFSGQYKSEDTAYKRFVKLSVYKALSEHFNEKLPWGSLTGVRPTKLAYEKLAECGDFDEAERYLIDDFLVTPQKAELIKDILLIQKPYVENLSNKINFYVHIPFCNGRCSYCSFPAADILRHKKWLDPYAEALVEEVKRIRALIDEQGKEVLSVYIGGGTPSVLSPSQLKTLLKAINCNGVEFTFEAGRADSIDEEKLKVLKEYGVNRICVNPQSLNDKTLEVIGRRHSVDDFYQAYNLADKYGFDINVDVIAGLEGEELADFQRTLNGVAELLPANITVHTLCKKRGSDLAEGIKESTEIQSMMDYAASRLNGKYKPYYVYRQKYMAGNLENIGYTMSDKACVNNITVMEELVPVYACGAGSISKNIINGTIVRHASVKHVPMYMEEFDSRLKRKIDFFCGKVD